MLPSHPPLVLILAQNPAAGRHLADLLRASTATVWLAAGDVPQGVSVDVIVTDLPSADAVREQAPAAGAGVIALGGDWADVALRQDPTSDELALACGLLAEVVRLRRERDQLAQVEKSSQILADTDPLTGLANRRVWDRELEFQWATFTETGRPLWLAIIDLDRFKSVNEQHGMAVGDRVLQSAASVLTRSLRPGDIIARIGGDEFGVLLADLDERSATGVFERLRATVADVPQDSGVPRQTISIGYARASAEHADSNALFAAADSALRTAKRHGQNGLGMFAGCSAAGNVQP